MSDHDDNRADDGGAYERTDARVMPLIGFSIALAVLIAVAMVVSAWIAASLTASHEASQDLHPLRAERTAPAGPVLQASPRQEYAAHQAWEDELLHHYAWIDATDDVVRIPIERAMVLIAERGLPTREEDR